VCVCVLCVTQSLRDENASVERNLLLQNEIVNRLQAQIKARDVKLMESAEQVTLLRIELGQREAYLLSASRLEELKSKVLIINNNNNNNTLFHISCIFLMCCDSVCVCSAVSVLLLCCISHTLL